MSDEILLYYRHEPHIIEGRSPSDDELDAECNVVGCMMADVAIGMADDQLNDHMIPLPFLAFGMPFHAAAYYIAIAQELSRGPTNPELVWEAAQHHPEAIHYGLQHLKELAKHADVSRLGEHTRLLRGRAARLLARERAFDSAKGTAH